MAKNSAKRLAARSGPKNRKAKSAAPPADTFQSRISGFTFSKDGGGSGGYGDRIRDKKRKPNGHYKDGYRPPKSVFLIYISFNSEMKFIVRQVEAPLGEGANALKTAEQILFDRAAAGNAGTFRANFEKMTWGDPCYITLVFGIEKRTDSDSWGFYWQDDDEDHSPIRFHRRKDIHGHGSKIFAENYSFYDGEIFEFVATDGKKYNAFRCINYIHTEFGPLQTDRELDYCFEIYLNAPLYHGPGYITLLVDPDGQNQGPRT